MEIRCREKNDCCMGGCSGLISAMIGSIRGQRESQLVKTTTHDGHASRPGRAAGKELGVSLVLWHDT